MIDHDHEVALRDRLFKELIQTFFWEFIELFIPEVLQYLSKETLTFFPEEVFTDVTVGEKRKIDLLAQVKWQEEDGFFLIHIENQAYNQKEFERRMFHYFARLDQKYRLPIYPIVLFSYDKPKREEKINIKEEKIMEIVTSWMEEGIDIGEKNVIKRQIKRRFNNLSQELEEKINSLSLSQIENLADAIFDFQSLDDVIHWLEINT